MTPVVGIPGVPTLFALLVTIMSLQMLVGRDHLWLPNLLKRRSAGHDRVRGAARRIRKPARWIDRHFSQRLEWATGPVATRIAALLGLVFPVLLPPLGFVPFAGVIPFIAITLLGLALTMREGLLMLVAFASSAVALWGICRVQPFI